MSALSNQIRPRVVGGTDYKPTVTDHSTIEAPSPQVDVRPIGEVSRRDEEADHFFRSLAGLSKVRVRIREKDIPGINELTNALGVSTPVQAARVKLDDRLDQIEARMDRQSEAVLSALKNHTTAPKSEASPQAEMAHNPTMTEVTRELLDAKLDSVRAEVRASIAESSKETVAAMGQLNTQMATMQGQMLTEMQGMRAEFANMAKEVAKELATTNVGVAQLNGKVEGLEGKIAGLDGKVTGLTTSISMLQWIVGSAIGLATIVLAIGAIFVAWMQLDLARQTSAPQTPAATQSAPAQPPK